MVHHFCLRKYKLNRVVFFKILKHVKQISLLCTVFFRYNLKVRYFIIFKYWF